MRGTGGLFARRAAHAALAGIAAALLLTAWVTVRVVLISSEYRQSPGEILHLAGTALLWYVPLLAAASVLLSGILALLRAPGGSSSPAGAHAGVAAFLFTILYGLGAFTGPAQDPLLLTWTVGLALAALVLVAVGTGMAAARLAGTIAASRRAALAAQTIWALASALLSALMVWSLLREHMGFQVRSATGILAAVLSLAAGATAGGVALAALRGGARLWRRLGSEASAAVLLLLPLAGLAALVGGGAAASWSTTTAQVPGGRPNVLFLVADTLRADRVGAYGAARTRTPALDALAARGTLFRNATAPASWTLPSTASLLTGLHPSSHGLTTYRKKLRADALDLAAILGHAGYASAGFVANPVLMPEHGFGRGFDLWDRKVGVDRLYRHGRTPLAASMRRLGLWNPRGHFPRAGDVVDRALDWLEQSVSEPFFLYLHFMDPHDPYAPPPPYDAMYGREPGDPFTMTFGTLPGIMKGQLPVGPPELEDLLALYDGAVTYMDESIGGLLEAMERDGRLENTLIVFVADHGEEFVDHGGLGHEHTLYQELVHVPLILAGPGVPSGGVIGENVSLVDVAPTVLEAVGVEPPLPMDGISLWRAASLGEEPPPRDIFMEETYIGQRYPIHSLVGIRRGDRKLIGSSFHARGAGPWTWEHYDLAADPGEKSRLEISGEAPAGEMRSALMAWLERAKGAEGTESTPGEERLELLRSLGYVD